MNITMINPEPRQHKGKLPVTDHLFYNTITRKYGRFKQPRVKFPSLIFLFNPQFQLPILQYLLVKNMNIFPGNRTGGNYHLHRYQHLDFVIPLLLRISPPAPIPAVTAPIEMMENTRLFIEMSHRTLTPGLLSQTANNHFAPAVYPHHTIMAAGFHQAVSSQTVTTPFYRTALTFPGKNENQFHSLPWKSQPASVYVNFSPRILESSKTSNLNMLIETTQKLVKEIHRSNTHSNTHTPIYTQPTILTSIPGIKIKISRPILLAPEISMLCPQLRITDFYPVGLTKIIRQASIGFSNTRQVYGESTPASEQQQSISKQTIPVSRHEHQLFFQDGKTSEMFINARQRLLKKIDLRQPGKIEMSSPTVSILPRLITTYFNHPVLTENRFPGSLKIDGMNRESTPAPGRQPSHPAQAGPDASLSSKQSESAVPTDTSLFDTVVTKRLLTPLHHYKKISHEENTGIKKMTVEKTAPDLHSLSNTQLPADFHHFNPFNRVANDLKKPGTVGNAAALDKKLEAGEDFKRKPEVRSESTGFSSSGVSQNPGIDLNQLTDQVYRILERKIRTEKERRGW